MPVAVTRATGLSSSTSTVSVAVSVELPSLTTTVMSKLSSSSTVGSGWFSGWCSVTV